MCAERGAERSLRAAGYESGQHIRARPGDTPPARQPHSPPGRTAPSRASSAAGEGREPRRETGAGGAAAAPPAGEEAAGRGRSQRRLPPLGLLCYTGWLRWGGAARPLPRRLPRMQGERETGCAPHIPAGPRSTATVRSSSIHGERGVL